MQVTISYEDGHLEIFDSGSLTSGAPFGRNTILTEFHIAWEEDCSGRSLVAYCHHIEDPGGSTDAESAGSDRMRGPRTVLAEPADVERIESVHVDGRLAAWKQGGRLVDALRFELACRKWYLGPSFATSNEKAVWLFRYLERAHGELGSDEGLICPLFGYPVESYREAEAEYLATAALGKEEEE